MFSEPKDGNIRNMETCLKIFELISGLKVNLSKSCLVGINMEEQREIFGGNDWV